MLLTQTGIPKKEINAYAKKHIATSDDLLRHFPRKYMDYRTLKSIRECTNGEYAAVRAKLLKITSSNNGGGTRNKKEKPKKKKQHIRLSFLCEPTGSGMPEWFNIDLFLFMFDHVVDFYINKNYNEFLQKEVVVTGKVILNEYGYSMQDTNIFHIGDFSLGILTVYPKIGGVEDSEFRKHLDYFIAMSGEIIEDEIRERYGLCPYGEVLRKIHHPQNFEEIEEARKQFIFYDLLLFNIIRRNIESRMSDTSEAVMTDPSLANLFLKTLEYPLTQLTEEERAAATSDGIISGGQREAVLSMMRITASGKRLNALVEGDVGCGKTAVASCMIMFAVGNGYQAVIMAPKTVLAKQHYEEIKRHCEKLGLRCAFLGGAKNADERKQRKEDLKGIKDGSINVIIGTHGCFSKGVEYKNLGLIIYDEEQAFGADQKIALYNKAVSGVHTIEMSATPIPRSLTMSIYSNKNIIRITKKPEGRIKIQTAACNNDKPTFEFVEKQLGEGRQCYVVAPAIEDNEDFGLIGVNSITEKYKAYFEPKGYTVVTANGQMKDDEFSEAVEQFRTGAADILVATTVIEVGVNVPNATVIVIEQAERFGLSQLHQLRGRVGRREYPSYCILMTKQKQNPRIKAMIEMSDGFEIAEADYRLRGPGDINGTEQSGENRFIDEIILYPDIYEKTKEAVRIYEDRPLYGAYFVDAYSYMTENEE